MKSEITSEQILDSLKADAPPGHDPRRRWVHSFGCGVTGRFIASEIAADHCAAALFTGDTIRITARFSNGSNDPERHDERADARGLAVKFHLADDLDVDLISMTIPVLGADTRPEYLGLTKAIVPKPVRRGSWFRRKVLDPLMLRQAAPEPPPGVTATGAAGMLQYSGSHHFARAFAVEAGLFMVPSSWARTKYHLVHTFIAVGPDGVRRPVRFAWQPVAGVFPLPPDPAHPGATDFLTDEMRQRLSRAPARFTLKMMFGDQGDEFDKPSVPWPDTRRVVRMGTLYLDAMAIDHGIDVDTMSFNPMRLPAGLEPSGDEMLRLRGKVYELGCTERGGVGCPFDGRNS